MSLELETTESLYPFVLTEEQEQLRREIRDFAAREIAPNVMKCTRCAESGAVCRPKLKISMSGRFITNACTKNTPTTVCTMIDASNAPDGRRGRMRR